MSTPTPRPALKKAADAHIHPAAPGHSPRGLRQAADVDEAATPAATPAATSPEASAAAVVAAGAAGTSAVGHRLSGPLGGTTSDSLRPRKGGGRRRPAGTKPEKTVELTVKVPKSLRKDFREAVKSTKADPNDVVTALLRAWLDS